MKFRNPWIDPRVAAIRGYDIVQYLVLNGWKESRSERPRARVFQRPDADVILFIPTAERADDYLESIIEAITQLARAEDRYAGAVLDDILAGDSTIAPGPVIGSTEPMTQPVAD